MGGVGKKVAAAANPVGLIGTSSAMGGKGGDAPSSPDFAAAAEAQANSGRINQNSPFGSVSWSKDPATGQWTQNVGFSDDLTAGAGNLMTQIGEQGPIGTGDDARNQAITSAYDQAASRLDPQWSQREESTRAQLAAQGLDPGSQAYDNAMGNFGRDRNDAYTSAMANAIGQGTAAGHVAFQDNLSAANSPFQRLGMLAGLTSGLTGQGNQTQYLNAANMGYQGDLNKYATDQAGKNSLMSGGSSLAGLAMLAGSDERLKMNIERLSLDALPGVPFASWEWKHEPGKRVFGVIAQDLEKVRPDLVHRAPNGMRVVDYSFLA
ncbi:MAG: hypothetical protein AzoDbin1_05371 [Azoarcus sp.]|jgi:hypothetical protein|nr:hypothetical protein [Azoarcus sp.]